MGIEELIGELKARRLELAQLVKELLGGGVGAREFISRLDTWSKIQSRLVSEVKRLASELPVYERSRVLSRALPDSSTSVLAEHLRRRGRAVGLSEEAVRWACLIIQEQFRDAGGPPGLEADQGPQVARAPGPGEWRGAGVSAEPSQQPLAGQSPAIEAVAGPGASEGPGIAPIEERPGLAEQPKPASEQVIKATPGPGVEGLEGEAQEPIPKSTPSQRAIEVREAVMKVVSSVISRMPKREEPAEEAMQPARTKARVRVLGASGMYERIDPMRLPDGSAEQALAYLARLAYLYVKGEADQDSFRSLAEEYSSRAGGADRSRIPGEMLEAICAVARELRLRRGEDVSALLVADVLEGRISMVPREAEGGAEEWKRVAQQR